MKRWVLTLFILLLPFRLWAADAMALQTIAWPEPPTHQMPCHGVAAAAEHAGHAGHAHNTEAIANGFCPQCDVCHNALSLPPLQALPLQPALPQTQAHSAASVISAEHIPTFKPPIG